MRQTRYGVKDVFKILDIRWDGMKSLGSTRENDIKTHYHPTPRGVQETIFISETQLYQVIFRLNKPKSIDFQNWVCGDVLPQIRKTGSYGKALAFNQIIKLEAHLLKLSNQINQAKSEFERDLLIERLRSTCNSLGQSMPNIKLIENNTTSNHNDQWGITK